MNLFMRCMSILFSGSVALLAPSLSYASLGSAVDTTTTNQAIYNHTTKEYNACLVDNPSNPTICKPPTAADKAAEKEAAEKEKEKKQQPPQGGQPQQGQQGQPEQQQQQQQQPQQQQSQAKGGNCGDGQTTTQPANNAEMNKNGAKKGEETFPGKGQQQACEQVKGSFDQRARTIANTASSVGLTTNFSSMDKDFEEYVKNREECLSNQAEANTQCMEGNSPSTSNASTGVGNVLGQVGQNASDTCGKFSNAMDIAKAGLAAFSANCGKAQGSCSSACSKANSGLKALVQKAEKEVGGGAKCDGTNPSCESQLQQYKSALQEGIQAAKQEMDSKDPKSVAGKLKTCDGKYAANIGNALQGVMGMLAGMMQGNKCEEETDGTPEQALGSLSDKCILPENASLPECICKLNPRTVGCGSAYNKMDADNTNQFGGGLADKANVDPKGDVDSAGLDGLNGMQHAPLKESGDVAGAPMGGGSAGIGNSTVGSGSGSGAAGDQGKAGLNANILAGTGGGGGSGKGWGAGGAGDKYRQYLPGGAKDPARNVAGQQAWTKEVTGQGGKSNWEKVKDRYRDNKSTLLNNN